MELTFKTSQLCIGSRDRRCVVANRIGSFAPCDNALLAAMERAESAITELAEIVRGGGFSSTGRLQALDGMGRSVNRLQAAITEDVRQIDEAADWRSHGARNLGDFIKHRLSLEATGWKYATLARNLGRIPRIAEAFAEGAGNIEQVYDCWQRLKELPQTVPEGAPYDEARLADVWAAADECLAERINADGLNGSQLKTCVEHILAGLDADGHQNGKNVKKKGHGLSVSKLLDETVISATADPVAGEKLDRALRKTNAWAKSGPDDSRSPRRRRLDALIELATHFLDCGQTPRRRSARHHLVVHVELPTLIRALVHASSSRNAVQSPAGEPSPESPVEPLNLLAGLAGTPAPRPAIPPPSSGLPLDETNPGQIAQRLVAHNPLLLAIQRIGTLSPAARLQSGATLGYRDLAEILSDPRGVDLTRVLTGPPGCVPRNWPGPGWPDGNLPGPYDSAGLAREPSAGDEHGRPQSGTDPTQRMAMLIRAMLATLPPPLGAPSELLDVGRTERFHTPAMRIGLTVRDGAQCVVPGCTMPAEYLQIHHVRQWHQHGHTNTGDAASCCAKHNNDVEKGAVLCRDPGGRWISRPPPDTNAS